MTQQVSGAPVAHHGPRFDRLDLERQLGRSVWLGRVDDLGSDEPIAARLAAGLEPEAPDREEALRRASDLAQLRSPMLVPLLGAADRDGTVWLVSEYVPGVPLSRLLGAATLTPVQAVYVALRVLQGLAALHEHGLGHGRLGATNVLVGHDGEPRLTDWALASVAQARDVAEIVEDDLVHAAGLMASLGRNVDRPAIRYHEGYGDLMDELQHLGRGEWLTTAAEAADRLARSLPALVGDATSMAGPRSELAALVAMLVQRSSPQRRAEIPAPRGPVPVPHLLPSGPLSEVDWHRPGRSWVRVVGVVLALTVLVLGGYAGVRELVDQLSRGAGSPSDHPTATKPASPSPSKEAGRSSTPRAVPALAPPRAGDVTGVTVSPVGACSARHSCLLRITVRMTPASQARAVGLQVSLVNRCTGKVHSSPAGTITAQPGWTSVFVTRTVRMPRFPSAAVVATTTTPARAASPPLLVPVDGGSC